MIFEASTGCVKKVFDDGYNGRPENTDNMVLLPDIYIPKSEYHQLSKRYKNILIHS